MSKDGDIAGACHRRAHLRSLGIEVEEPDDSKLVMFQMGTANEDVVYNDLVQTSVEGEVILREEEIPIGWLTTNRTPVTGRPDMVICQKVTDTKLARIWREGDDFGYQPLWGVEIKSIASVWTSREILGNQQPKMDALIQAGHYSWQLGVPFRLLYKQYSIQEIPFWSGADKGPGWGQKLFPRQGAPGSEHIDYEKGRVQPFEVSWELRWAKGYLEMRREHISESGGNWIRTMVRHEDISRYYEFVSGMASEKKLGPRPMTVDAAGKEKSFSNCKYCPLYETCQKTEKKGYDVWITAVKQALRAE